MIISHSQKFCYWKIARTGSNTAELCIRMSDMLDLSQDLVTSCHFFPAAHNVEELESGHTTPTDAISKGYLTPEQYDAYDHYTIVREPMERWVSAYSWQCREKLVVTVTPQEFFDGYKDDLVCRKQSDYIDNRMVTFPFSDYENSVRQIVPGLIDIPRIVHKTRGLWRRMAQSHIETTSLGDELREYYRDDFKLGF